MLLLLTFIDPAKNASGTVVCISPQLNVGLQAYNFVGSLYFHANQFYYTLDLEKGKWVGQYLSPLCSLSMLGDFSEFLSTFDFSHNQQFDEKKFSGV